MKIYKTLSVLTTLDCQLHCIWNQLKPKATGLSWEGSSWSHSLKLLLTCLLTSLSLPSSSIYPVVAESFFWFRTSSFRFLVQTEDQQLSRNPQQVFRGSLGLLGVCGLNSYPIPCLSSVKQPLLDCPDNTQYSNLISLVLMIYIVWERESVTVHSFERKTIIKFQREMKTENSHHT